MTDQEFIAKTEEVDRLLNDPATPILATLVWDLVEDLSSYTGKTPELQDRRR